MFATVRALFEHIIDYAGLFPPARLPLPEALRNYAGYVSGPRQWLVGRFVCPAVRLEELTAEARSARIESGLQVAVLGQGGGSSEEFLSHLADDVKAVERLREAWWPDVADVLEVALPAGLTAAQTPELLTRSAGILEPTRLRSFFEVPGGADFGARLQACADALSKHGANGAFGLKIRCGGASADAFPSDELLADFMVCCRAARVPWKATAGLHHPLRHWDEGLQVLTHGFLNVFGAGLLSYAHSLTAAQLVEILRDREGASFWFQNERFGWKHWGCSLREVKDLRRRWLPSFGSCSIDEPCADLVGLGMIPAEGAVQS
jgi:hypothetical protein